MMSDSDSSKSELEVEEYEQNRTPEKKIKTAKQKGRGEYKFNESWLENESFKNWILKINDDTHNVSCRICNVKFTFKYRGINALKQHMQSGRHIKLLQNYTSCTVMSNFYRKTSMSNDEVIISELILTYHGVKHHHSYLSQECCNKILKNLYHDSKNAQQLSCGRTKAEALVELVLAPFSLELILQLIKNNPYSICTDASNKGNRKMFPVSVRFFDEKQGPINAILDFYEDPNESSTAIANQLMKCIDNTGLPRNKLVSYGADNASVNFGKNNSVFVHLRNELNLPKLVAGHCNTHILHNTVKYGLKLISYDVENLVSKVYAVFSSSAKEVENLKEFSAFVKCEYSSILRHVPTRFLSLYPAVDRLLANWDALKSYFISKGKEKVNKGIWVFLGQTEEGLNTQISLAELYIYFVHNLMYLFQNVMKTVESDYIQTPQVYRIINDLKRELICRRDKVFFGSKVYQNMKYLSAAERSKLQKEGVDIYNRMISYLEKWFDFSEQSFFYISSSFNLDDTLTFEQAYKVANFFELEIDGDQLFSEVRILNDASSLLTGTGVEKWVQYFKINKDAPILLNLCQYVFAVPPNNCYVERIFSVMGNIWTNERNRLHVEMVKAELFIHFNFEMTCSEFSHFIKMKTDANKKLIDAAKSTKKYKFKISN